MGYTYTRCPWCRMLKLRDGKCDECGFTGTCPYCDYEVDGSSPHPQHHDGPCAGEASAETLADQVRTMTKERTR